LVEANSKPTRWEVCRRASRDARAVHLTKLSRYYFNPEKSSDARAKEIFKYVATERACGTCLCCVVWLVAQLNRMKQERALYKPDRSDGLAMSSECKNP
jgi:hypothetical protein